jgi:hypothetical protein
VLAAKPQRPRLHGADLRRISGPGNFLSTRHDQLNEPINNKAVPTNPKTVMD